MSWWLVERPALRAFALYVGRHRPRAAVPAPG